MHASRMLHLRGAGAGVIVLAILLMLPLAAGVAMPPHPSLLEVKDGPQAVSKQEFRVPDLADLHARGICTPERFLDGLTPAKSGANLAPPLGPFRVLGLLVDFSDNTSSVADTYFDSLVFGATGTTVRSYFDEISYSQIDLVTVNLPSAQGWNRAPQTYAYYVNALQGLGSYPQNAQKLVEDLVDLVDPAIDFSQYDNDSDGDVDVLLVIHAGSGAELTASANDIWSHKWSITPRSKDGVSIISYTAQPEYWFTPGDMTIGVYSHELSHGFGLPDLYDTDGSSNGIGKWGLMASGSWNGSLGASPAHPCAWSRIQMGFTTPVNVTGNITQQAIGAVNTGGSIFRLWTSGVLGNEYFLVENRQKTGYDAALPGDGLMVWHIDDSKSTNQQEWWPGQPAANHYLVALEQADGLYELDSASSSGDSADPFPGTGSKTSFNGVTSPSSDGYLTGGSFVAVENISASGMTMNADLIVGIAAGVGDDDLSLPTAFALAQNYPNPFNPITRIEFTLNRASDVSLKVYNTLGEEVKTLAEGRYTAGTNGFDWDGTSGSGKSVASGVYFYEITIDDQESASKKMLLLK